MKYTSKIKLTLFLLAISLCTFGQELRDSITDKRVNELLNEFENKTITEAEKKEIKDLTYKIQNQGFILEEKANDYQGSLEKINRALNIWITLADTINEANNRKYKGYLLGHLKDFPGAKREISFAINLFKIKKWDFGIAVSQFDLAKVYDFEGKSDSSLICAKLALQFWKTKRDTGRILIINNQLMHLCYEMKKFNSASTIQKESRELMKNKTLNYHSEIDFYFLSYAIYKKQRIKKLSIYYKDKLERISKENGIVKSGYDVELKR